MQGVGKAHRALPARRRIQTSPGEERRIQWIAGYNLRFLRRCSGRMGSGGCIGVRVDRESVWFTRRGAVRILAGNGGAMVKDGLYLRKLSRAKSMSTPRLFGPPQATIHIYFRDFLGKDGIERVVWSRGSPEGLDRKARRVIRATEALFRQDPRFSSEAT